MTRTLTREFVNLATQALIAACVCLAAAPATAAFTEFYCNPSTGSNVNAGSTEGAPILTGDADDWVSSTGVYTFGTATDLSGVTVGMFAAVRVDGATKAALVGRITNVNDGADTVTISTTAKSGSLADQSDTASIAIGGAWQGPNGSEGFPLNFVDKSLISATNEFPRINLKNNASYSITAAVSINQAGPLIVEGYASTAGDGGQATIDGGNPATSIELLSVGATADDLTIRNLIVQNNGSTSGTSAGIAVNSGASGLLCERVKVSSIRGNGFSSASGSKFVECEAVTCNKSNTTNGGGFSVPNNANGVMYLRCYARGNTTTEAAGFFCGIAAATYVNCIAANNTGGYGWNVNAGPTCLLVGCDAYNNARAGLILLVVGGAYHNSIYATNCNFVKNGAGGVSLFNISGDFIALQLRNCGYGAGTQANTGGDIVNTAGGFAYYEESGKVTYPANSTPWNDPANGDFRITLPQAKGAGRGVFPAGATNTVGFPDIGAAQSLGAGGGVSRGRIVNQ